MNKSEVAQAIPPTGVVGLTLFGMPLSEWVYAVTLIWTVFLIIDKLPTVASRIRSAWRWLKEK